MKKHIYFRQTVNAPGFVEGDKYEKGKKYWVDGRDAIPWIEAGIAIPAEQAKPPEPRVITKPVTKKRTYRKRTKKAK